MSTRQRLLLLGLMAILVFCVGMLFASLRQSTPTHQYTDAAVQSQDDKEVSAEIERFCPSHPGQDETFHDSDGHEWQIICGGK